jgi:hypothetical protein
VNQILLLVDQPLDERNFDRFGIQTWIDRGWSVEVWDLTPLAYPGVWKKHLQLGGTLKNFQGYCPIGSKAELRRHQRRLRNTGHFIDFTGDYWLSARVKAHLIRQGVSRIVCATGSIPSPAIRARERFASKLRLAVSVGFLRAARTAVGASLQKLTAPFIRPRLVVVSGAESIPAHGRRHTPEIIRAHNLDYDVYLTAGRSGVQREKPFIAFIDQDYCFHPEYIYQGVPRVVTPDNYFPAVCRGLRAISEALDMDIRVAAHPRSAYQQGVGAYFEEIPVEYGKTADLIRDCNVVVCHDSTAIQLAVLYGKPVIFFSTDQLDALQFDGMRKREVIAHFASELGKPVINVDRDLNINWRKELFVDLGKYAEYRRKYIKMDGSGELPYWEIVSRHLEKLSMRGAEDCPQHTLLGNSGDID